MREKKDGSVVVSTTVLYASRNLGVVEDKLQHPTAGRRDCRYLWMSPQVRVVPLTPGGKLVLVREFKYPNNDYFLGVPAGKKREEETSYTTESFVDLGAFHPMAKTLQQDAGSVLALDVRPLSPHQYYNHDAYEKASISVILMDPAEVVAAVDASQLTDGQALAVLFKAFVHLGLVMPRQIPTQLAFSG